MCVPVRQHTITLCTQISSVCRDLVIQLGDMTSRPAYPTDLSDARWALIEPVLCAWRAGLAGWPGPVGASARLARDRQRDLVREPGGVCMAAAAARFPAVQDRL